MSSFPSPRFCVGLLLAAGLGRRFAARAPGADKLLATMPGGQAVAQASAANLLAVVPRVVAVVRPESTALGALLRAQGCIVIAAAEARHGMGASLAAAARHLAAPAEPGSDPAPTALLVALADMPWIRPATAARVLQGLDQAAVAAPSFQGRRGHPVAFRAALLPELAALEGDVGARALFERHRACLVAVDDPGVLRDVDLPSDLPAAASSGTGVPLPGDAAPR